jgi:two-component system cell cycle sensor histidine kinase/response regulator CckA
MSADAAVNPSSAGAGPRRPLWPVLAGHAVALGAVGASALAAGPGNALVVAGGGLAAIAALDLAVLLGRERRAPADDKRIGPIHAALVTTRDDPAALTDLANNLLAVNTAWDRVLGRRYPRELQLSAVDVAREPVLVTAGEASGERWLARARLIAAEGPVLWTLSPAEPSRPLSAALERAGLGWAEIGPDGRVTALGGLLRDLAAPGQRLDDVLVPLDSGGIRRRAQRVSGPPVTLDLVQADAGRDNTRLAVAIDVGADLALRAALVEAETRFRRFFNDAPVGIAVIDRHGDIVEANAAFAGLVVGERESQSVIGRVFGDLVHGDDRPDLLASLKASDEAAFGAPTEIRFKGAKERVAQLYASRQGTGDEAIGLLFLLETTEQKNLELQFAQSQKMQAVGQLAGGIAHDFNNLLTAIIGFSDLLLMRHSAGDQFFADIMQIKQNANRAANLVRQLLAFSRQQTLRPKVLDVTDVLAELSNLLRRLIGENIELRMVHGRDLGLVRVDPGQLDQVIINLAVNARDAMSNGGVLTIRTANVMAADVSALGHALMPAADYVLIEVSDTGHGIAKENLGKIFEPFFTTKEVGAGTGLGLSTVYGIVKQTGGFIFPTSEAGKGATFSIYLPRHVATGAEAAAAGEGTEREAGRDLTGKGTILLVEDEDAVRIFAARALRNKGYTVLEAASGDAALEIVTRHEGTIDLLISDVVMPNMDGPTLIKHARRHRQDMKIIFISGYAEDAFRKNLDRDEPFSFLPKPFSLKQLAGKVKEAIGGG